MHTKTTRRFVAALLATAALASAGCLYPELTPLRMDRTDTGPADEHMHDDAAAESGAAIPMFHQCTVPMYIDRSAPTAERLIEFGGATFPFSYSVPCMIISAGQTVRFQGSFLGHPLEHGVSPADMDAGSPNNPIPRLSEGMMTDVTFPTAGTYPYFCQMHYLAGMTGVIHVQ